MDYRLQSHGQSSGLLREKLDRVSAAKLRVIDRFTDPTMSSELRDLMKVVTSYMGDAFENGSGNNLSELEVHVLSIAGPQVIDNMMGPDATGWISGLRKRTEEFVAAGGGPRAIAFAMRCGNRKVLCVSMPTAERLLHAEATIGMDYTEEQRSFDSSVVAHEIIHLTSEGLVVARTLGNTFEELRAEHFSGTNTYHDAQCFSAGLFILTGKSLTQYIADKPQGGNVESVYGEIAADIGLARMLEIALINPAGVRTAGGLPNFSQANIGGYDGILNRIMVSQVEHGHGEAIMQRTDSVVRSILNEGGEQRLNEACIQLRQAGFDTLAVLFETRGRMASTRSGQDPAQI